MAGLAEQLIEQLNGVDAKTFDGDDFSRQQWAMAARKLFHKLETKEERTFRLVIEDPIMFSVLQAAIDMGLWNAWTATGGGEKDIEELAMMTTKDVDPGLLQPQLRLMAANNIVEETGQDRYAPTPLSLALGEPVISHSVPCHWPEFLDKTNYRKPVDDKDSYYIDAFPEKKSFFERRSANPVHQESFSSIMDLWGKYKRLWPQFYDTETLLQGADLSDCSAFVVDVGGHHTIDLLRVLEKHPDLPAASLVLEDSLEVVAAVKPTTDKIRIVGHDLFEPDTVQPVKAEGYEAAAMKPGYSKVLIHDIVIPPAGTSSIQAGMDCLVLQTSANQRSENRVEKDDHRGWA
ncbi:MAG: hypothetical protein Q9211_000808 [Gyalolechia sp. 1 TL-2023]